MEIWVLKRQGFSNRAIARTLKIHRKTVKKYLQRQAFPAYRGGARRSALAPYYQMIEEWLCTQDYQATRVHELVKRQGYAGSYETVKRYVRGIKQQRDRIAYLRFETLPGQQAQVDFADFQIALANGEVKTLYVFVMVLGYSRHMYIELVERCTMTVFLDCHQHALRFFGGVPCEILYDNMRNVVVRRHVGRTEFNGHFLGFCAHWGFQPIACPPYAPWYKGKVERPIHYIRERFWRGSVYSQLAQANRDILVWNHTVAQQRVHGTTKEPVGERFEGERRHLGALPGRPYDTSEKVTRNVYRDCQISFAGNRYVLPHTLVGRVVLVKIKNGLLRVYDDQTLHAEYPIPPSKGPLLAHPRFYEALRADQAQRHRNYRLPAGKAKATRGLLTHGLLHETVQRRSLAVYEALLSATGAPLREEMAHV